MIHLKSSTMRSAGGLTLTDTVLRSNNALGGAKAKSPRMSQWYVVRTLPRKERVAEINLARQSFGTFCPYLLKTQRRGRRFEEVRAPVFPGYLFVGIDPERDRWRSVNGTLGVSQLLLGERGLPMPMPIGAMEELFARCDGARMVNLYQGLQPGSGVRIVEGPFARRLASLERADDNGRVRVLLEVLGCRQVLTLNPEAIEPV